MSKGIRFFGKMQTGNARVSHAAMALGSDLLVEALWRVRIKEIKKYQGQKIVIYRIPNKTKAVREEVAKQAALVAGDSYPIWRIPLFAMDATASGVGRLLGRKKPVYWFTSVAGLRSFRVCSQLIAYSWQKFGDFDFGEDWRHISPDYLDDFGRMFGWKCVYDSIDGDMP